MNWKKGEITLLNADRQKKKSLTYLIELSYALHFDIIICSLLVYRPASLYSESVCKFFEGSVFTFQYLNDKIHNYVFLT